MEIRDEVIFISGASSGIGRELCLNLAQNNTVIASGRSLQRLLELEKLSQNIEILQFDVSDSSKVDDTRQVLHRKYSHIDRVILNAGDCEYIDPSDIDWTVFERMMSVNFFGWLNTLKITLDLLDSAKRPHVVGIASQAIFAPFSKASAYGASKAAASYFIKSLALDIYHRNIDTTLIHPGFVDTPLTQKNSFTMPWLMTVEQASERIINAIEKRKPELIFPRRLYWLLFLSKVFPEVWFNKMAWNPTHEKETAH